MLGFKHLANISHIDLWLDPLQFFTLLLLSFLKIIPNWVVIDLKLFSSFPLFSKNILTYFFEFTFSFMNAKILPQRYDSESSHLLILYFLKLGSTYSIIKVLTLTFRQKFTPLHFHFPTFSFFEQKKLRMHKNKIFIFIYTGREKQTGKSNMNFYSNKKSNQNCPILGHL